MTSTGGIGGGEGGERRGEREDFVRMAPVERRKQAFFFHIYFPLSSKVEDAGVREREDKEGKREGGDLISRKEKRK